MSEDAAVRAYCTEEVTRQGHNVHAREGRYRVHWMLDAWTWARARARDGHAIDVAAIEHIGRTVEQVKNKDGIRRKPVVIAGQVRAQPHGEIREQLAELCRRQDEMPAIEWYKAFELIHPFADGNGRTGKVLLAWLLDRWDDPVFPPNDLFGTWIINP